MPIAFDKTSIVTGTGASYFVDHNCSGIDRLLTVGFRGGGGEGDRVNSVAYNGVAFTRVGKVTAPGDASVIQLWYLLNPASGLNTFTLTYSSSGFFEGQIASYTGIEQDSQPDNSTTKTQTGQSITTSLTPIKNNCWTILGVSGQGVSEEAGTGSTQRGENLYDSGGPISPASSYSMTVQADNSSGWGAVMASFSPALGNQVSYIF